MMSDFLREAREGFNIADLGSDHETQEELRPLMHMDVGDNRVAWNEWENVDDGDVLHNVTNLVNENNNCQKDCQARKVRGPNKLAWAIGAPEKLKFNEAGQWEAPADKCAKFGRFIGMTSRDHRRFPISEKDWRNFRKGVAIDDAWEHVKATIDWTDPETAALEDRIRLRVENRLDERWKHFKCRLKCKWYTNNIGTDERFVCGDKRVREDHWKELVAWWDGQGQVRSTTNTENRKAMKMSHNLGTRSYAQLRYEYRQEHGHEPDMLTMFMLTHTRGVDKIPVDAESERVIALFKKKIADRELLSVVVDDQEMMKIYSEVLGPEKNNRVRGYGSGITWADVPGIVTEKRGLSSEVQTLRANYESAVRRAYSAEMEMQRLRDEQDKIREENIAAMARQKAELDASFQATVIMEMNKAMQSAGFADLASALAALRNVAGSQGV